MRCPMQRFTDSLLDKIHKAYQGEYKRWDYRRSHDKKSFEVYREIDTTVSGSHIVVVRVHDKEHAEEELETLRGRAAATAAITTKAADDAD